VDVDDADTHKIEVTQVAKDMAQLSQCGFVGSLKSYRETIYNHNNIFLGSVYASNFDEKLDEQLKEQDAKSSSDCYDNFYRIGRQFQRYQIESAVKSRNGKYLHSRLLRPSRDSEKTFGVLMSSFEEGYSYPVRVCLSTKEDRIKYSKTFKKELQGYLVQYWPYKLGDEVKASSMGMGSLMYGALIFEPNEVEKPQKCTPYKFFKMGMTREIVHVLSAIKDDKAGVWLHRRLLNMEP
jgi:hypothetical protein